MHSFSALGWLLVLPLLSACTKAEGTTKTGEPPNIADDGPKESTVLPQRIELPKFEADDRPRCVYPLLHPPPPLRPDYSPCPAPDESSGERPSFPRGTVKLKKESSQSIDAMWASDRRKRAYGLMFASELGPNEGMIFEWPEEQAHQFWMHNTCLSLDMLFIDAEGFITGVLENVPPYNDLPRTIDCPVKYVLELRAGQARRLGYHPGQKVELTRPPRLSSASND